MYRYKVISRKNPINKQVKYYAQPDTPQPADINTISERIAACCTLTRHDILACLSAFQEQLILLLQEGRSIKFGDVGTFRVTLRSAGTMAEKEFNSSFVNKVHVVFHPSTAIKRSLMPQSGNIKFIRSTEEVKNAPPVV